MEKEMIFGILGIDGTAGETEIRDAYMERLKRTHPEDDPEGFKRLRTAYDEALALLREQEEALREPEEKTETEKWLEKLEWACGHLKSRLDEEIWADFLHDPLCEDLDTAEDARDAFLVWLTNHPYFPQEIWRLFDQTFQITADQEFLRQRFPESFLQYVLHYIENPPMLPYEQFSVTDPEKENLDAYLSAYQEAGQLLDQGELEQAKEKAGEMAFFGLYHPRETAMKIRILLCEKKNGEALKEAETLFLKYGASGDVFLKTWCAEAFWAAKEKERAVEIWEGILAEYPEHAMSRYGRARSLMEAGEYAKAKEILLDFLDREQNMENQSLWDMLWEANDHLIRDFSEKREQAETAKQRMKWTLEIGWCLFQNDQVEEAVRLIEAEGEAGREAAEKYDYVNLLGRLYYEMQEYGKSYPLLSEWKAMIEAAPDDKKRRRRLAQACSQLGFAAGELGYEKEAFACMDQAIDAEKWEESAGDPFLHRANKARLFLKYGRDGEAMGLSEEILAENPGYYPAYLIRQKAAYRLGQGQQAVYDYHSAVELYGGCIEPYETAARVFLEHGQPQDAKKVIDRARENEAEFSPEMRLCELWTERYLSRDADRAAEALSEALELASEAEKDPEAFFDASEVWYELGNIYWRLGRHQEALESFQTAVKKNAKRLSYRMACAHLYLDMDGEWFSEAEREYAAAEPVYGESAAFQYEWGRCLEACGRGEEAAEAYQKAMSFDPAYRDAWSRLLFYYKSRYREEKRTEFLEKGLAVCDMRLVAGETPDVYMGRADLLRAAGDHENALADYERALAAGGKDWELYHRIGCCLMDMGRKKEAGRYMRMADTIMERERRQKRDNGGEQI